MRGTQLNKRSRGLAAALQAAIGVAALLVGVAGCTTQGGQRSLVIVQNQVPSVTDSGGCSVPGKRTDSGPRGTLDVEMDRPRPYQMYPLVTNLLPKFTEMDPYNPNLVTLQGFDVKLEPPPGVTLPSDAACPTEFSETAPNVLVAPGDQVASSIDAIKGCHADRLRAMFKSNMLPWSVSAEVVITAKIRARGSQGGVTALSDEFVFPIRVCYGCLQQGFELAGYQGFGLDPATGRIAYPVCDQLKENPYKGNPCNPAQDFGPLLCCARVAMDPSTLECPGIPRDTTTP